MESFKEGKVNKPYFLKRSDKRKILQKAKFDSMKPKQREKQWKGKGRRDWVKNSDNWNSNQLIVKQHLLKYIL